MVKILSKLLFLILISRAKYSTKCRGWHAVKSYISPWGDIIWIILKPQYGKIRSDGQCPNLFICFFVRGNAIRLFSYLIEAIKNERISWNIYKKETMQNIWALAFHFCMRWPHSSTFGVWNFQKFSQMFIFGFSLSLSKWSNKTKKG